jgi:hypothetical protein
VIIYRRHTDIYINPRSFFISNTLLAHPEYYFLAQEMFSLIYPVERTANHATHTYITWSLE